MSNLKEKEQALMDAGEALGIVLAEASENQKQILLKIKEAVEKYSIERESSGIFIDKSSIYAAAIMLDDELKADDALMEAAKHYIDADYEYIKAQKDQ